MFSPQNQVRIISNSTTFYPIDSRGDVGLTLINSIAFLQENFKEAVESFTAEDQIVVLQMWNGLLFSITSPKMFSEEILRFMLQIIKDTATFLFGPHFENNMSNNISQTLRELYAKYLEKFFSLANKDYKYILMIPPMDFTYSKLTNALKEYVKTDLTNINETFIEGIIFRNHTIISRFSRNDNPVLELSDIFQLCLLEQVVYPDDVETTSLNLNHLKIHLKSEGQIQSFIVSSGKCGSCVVIIISNINQIKQEDKDRLSKIGNQINQIVLSTFGEQGILPESYQITGLLHYILINRTTGEIYETQHQLKNQHDPKWAVLKEQLKYKMSSIAMQALISGSPSVIRNEMIFQYTYDLIFVNKKQKEVIPKNMQPITFNDRSELSWKQITSDFVSEDNVTCYEMLTVYLGVMNTADVIKANSHLFKTITGTKKLIE